MPKHRRKRKTKLPPALVPEYYNNSIFALALRPSQIEGAGLGVVALEPIAEGEHLGYYEGVLLTDWPGGSPYYVELVPRTGIDAQPYPRCYMAMINDAYGSAFANNCQLIIDDSLLQASVVTTRIIQPGEELFMSYGDSYWKEF